MKHRLTDLGISIKLINSSGIDNEEAHDLLEMHEKGQITKADIIEELRSHSDEEIDDRIGPNGYKAIGNNPWALSEFFSSEEMDNWDTTEYE